MRFVQGSRVGQLVGRSGTPRDVAAGIAVHLPGGIVVVSCWAEPPSLSLVGFARPGITASVDGRSCAGAFLVEPGETLAAGDGRWTWRLRTSLSLEGARTCGYCHGALPERRAVLVPGARPPFETEPLCLCCGECLLAQASGGGR